VGKGMVSVGEWIGKFGLVLVHDSEKKKRGRKGDGELKRMTDNLRQKENGLFPNSCGGGSASKRLKERKPKSTRKGENGGGNSAKRGETRRLAEG